MANQENNTSAMSPAALEPAAFSNGIRLSLKQWLGVCVAIAVLVLFAPDWWNRLEEFPLEADYRMPEPLSEDYWLYKRFVDLAVERYDTLVLGDSVIWGEYVNRHQTLPHYLNERSGGEGFANLGLLGAHPLALEGLIQHYTANIRGKKVVLECNPLWMSSLRQDLQGDESLNEFSHPNLVPQFMPWVPRYEKEISHRLGILVEQRFPFAQWTKHLQLAYFGTDIPQWTMKHPYDNPLGLLMNGLPAADETPRHLPLPWFKTGITRQDYAWIDLETSLQWHAFQRVVHILLGRGNRVFVLVGPFNEHLLTPGSLQRYEKVKATIKSWLETNQIAHLVAAPLPSAEYGDASHPLAPGYARLAGQVLDTPFFRDAK